MATKLKLHLNEWRGCDRCALSQKRTKVVQIRGKIPCDILFIGESPGKVEDVAGVPFVGPAGELLDHMIRKAKPMLCGGCGSGLVKRGPNVRCALGHENHETEPHREARIAYANILGCIPLDDNREKMSDPDEEFVMACRPRLERLAEIAKPKLIVCVGVFAMKWLEPGMAHTADIDSTIPRLGIYHPSYILRSKNVMVQDQLIRNTVSQLKTEFKHIGHRRKPYTEEDLPF